VWFFSFIAWYSQIQRRRHNVVLLLDEPGLALHGRGQGDLLRYFEEELKPHHQLIYTTHSPFMVDPTHFDRVRIVQDKSIDVDGLPKEQQGTKVLTEIFEASEDSLFPLQGALGYDIHQTLFIGPNTLLVEGPSDMLYIQAMSALLDKSSRESLSPKWTLTPAGGAAKVPTLVRLLTVQRGMKIATLLDMQEHDRKMIENLYREKLLRKNNVLTYADFTGTKEADVEDMLEVDFYLRLVNEEYKGVLTKPITASDLVSKSPRIVVRLSEYFKTTPLKRGAFSHYRPARYFHENVSTLASQISDATKQRFEASFTAANKLL
jgi:predicted ATP-dependent endonuclease of OLD family